MYHSPLACSLSLYFITGAPAFLPCILPAVWQALKKLLIRNAVNLLQSDQDADPDTVAAQFHLGDDFPAVREAHDLELYRDLLMYDLYLRENAKSRPSFAREQAPFKEAVKQFFIKEAKIPSLLEGYEDYDSRQISKMAHAEGMRDQSVILFDYRNRDDLFGNARAFRLILSGGELVGSERLT